MNRNSFRRNTAWAVTAALAVVGSIAVAASDPGTPAAMPGGSNGSCGNSNALIQQLATIDRSGDDSFQCLGLSVAGGTVTAIRLETHRFTSSGGHPDAEQVSVAEFPIAVVESTHGAVLDGVPGHDAIILQGQFSVPPDTAVLVASYLYNGFTGEYHSCRVEIARVRGDGWRLIDQFSQTISHIVVRTRRLPLLGMFGIANLDGACA